MKKILIVDDEMGIVDEVRDFLTEEGYEVHTADTGKDGIDRIQVVKPDLLILDMKLPDMSGLEVLKVCKETQPETKVIVNTGYVDQKIIDESERLGRDTFLQKPFDLERLRTEVDRLLG
ncbi:MAG: response regulator [Candidatus Omnitrophica bacterium]|nr:response regulator [Candidatus Omnitrophota bacterium]MDD5671888.1 response regulator [Candidatus Omnitrophota bacterium]